MKELIKEATAICAYGSAVPVDIATTAKLTDVIRKLLEALKQYESVEPREKVRERRVNRLRARKLHKHNMRVLTSGGVPLPPTEQQKG
jgi:hypothetical protein